MANSEQYNQSNNNWYSGIMNMFGFNKLQDLEPVEHHQSFAEWKIEVYNDDKQTIRALFLSWSELIQTHGRTMVGALPSEYKQTGFVTQFDRANNETAKFKFTGIFPSDIAEIELKWGEGGDVESFAVTLQVDWFEPV